jgi:hypothetical protein
MRKNSSATTSSTEKNETTRGRNGKFHAWVWNALIGSGNPYRVLLNGFCLQGPRGGTATRLACAPPLVGVVADCLVLSEVLRLLHAGVVHRVIEVTCQAQSIIVRLYRTAATSANLTQVTSMFRVGPDTSQCLIPVPASDRVFTQTHVHFCTVMKFTNSR